MPAKLPVYSILTIHPSPAVLDAFLAVDDTLARLDERAKLSGIRDSLAARLLFRNACAGIENRGSLVFLEDLVLLDGHAFGGRMSADLSEALATLKLWQRALRSPSAKLLDSTMPGEEDRPLAVPLTSDGGHGPDDETIYDPDFNQAERLQRWREVLQATRLMPPLLAAATVWDAWHVLCPEPQGHWRATLLAALTLAARCKVTGWLLPLDTGEKESGKNWCMTASTDERCLAFLGIVEAATRRARRELDALASVRNQMLLRIDGASRHSHLPQLVDLVIAKPLISIPLASKALRVSPQAIAKMLPRLGSTLREITDRQRYRCWTAP